MSNPLRNAPAPTLAEPLHPGKPIKFERAALRSRLATLTVIIVPLLSVVAAPFVLWRWGFGWVDFGLLAGMYVLTALGVTVGFHRLFTHKSFETIWPVRFTLAVLGSMAIQGPVIKWVALHRRHHQLSDSPDDPHTPHQGGGGFASVLRGFWHAHIGWAFRRDPMDLDRYVKDLRQSPTIRLVSALFPLWIVLGLAIPAILGGVLSGGWAGVLLGFVWGGLMRIFLVHHVTWSVNSIGHLWGKQPYPEGDQSRNNFLLGVLAMGEGWHNNHHAFPTSARHGLRWWQLDVSYYFIRLLALAGLAWKIRLPRQEEMAESCAGVN
jgi:stearoyl-CoA desaturase (delta-9 desaturase)